MPMEIVSDKMIGVDLDGTLVKSDEACKVWYGQNYGVDFSSYSTRQMWEHVHGLGVKKLEMMGAFIKSGEFADAPVFEDAGEVLVDLSKRNGLVFITSRPLNHFNLGLITTRWIEGKLPGLTPPITLIQAFSRDMPIPGLPGKGEICHREGVDVLVDNMLDHAEECAVNGTKVVLFDPEEEYPNYELPRGVERVTRWMEVPGAISRLLKAPWKPGDPIIEVPLGTLEPNN